MQEPIAFTSAYRQLRPAEKSFVDGYVAQTERECVRMGERISNALYRAIPAAVVDASRGMLEKPMVRAAITERINQIAADSELTVQRVIKELMAISFASIGDYMQVDGNGQPWFDLSRATPEQLSAIASVEIEDSMRGTRKFKFKLHDKLSGMDKLMRYMGLLESDNPHWRAETARPVNAGALPAGVSDQEAGDVYARMING